MVSLKEGGGEVTILEPPSQEYCRREAAPLRVFSRVQVAAALVSGRKAE